jgi:hypothetical protein
MNRRWLGVIAVGLAFAVVVALFSPLASSHPDGLEKVAEDKGFLEEGKGPSYEIIPDYTFPGVENESVSTILSGLVGIAIVAALGFGLALVLRALSRQNTAGRSGAPPEAG